MRCAGAAEAPKLLHCSSRGWRRKDAHFCYTLEFPSDTDCHFGINHREKFMLVLARRSALALLAFAFCATCVLAQGWQHLGAVQRVEKLKDGVELTAGHAKVRITAFNDALIRVRVAPEGNFPKDSSWAVIAAPQPPAPTIQDARNELKMTAGNTTVIVQKSPLLIRF